MLCIINDTLRVQQLRSQAFGDVLQSAELIPGGLRLVRLKPLLRSKRDPTTRLASSDRTCNLTPEPNPTTGQAPYTKNGLPDKAVRHPRSEPRNNPRHRPQNRMAPGDGQPLVLNPRNDPRNGFAFVCNAALFIQDYGGVVFDGTIAGQDDKTNLA